MSFLDTIAGLAVGAFLLAVAVQGNSKKFVETIKRDKAFLQWAVAIGILFYLYTIPELKGPIGMLIIAAFIGLGLVAGPKIFSEGGRFWQSFGE